MKILVYGAGVVGSFYAARLHEAGNDVSLLARGRRLEALRTQGVVLEPIGEGPRASIALDVAESLEPDDAYDLIIVAVRRNHLESVLPALAANEATPNVLFLGNNASGPGEHVAALGRSRVLMGFGGVAGVLDGARVRYVSSPHGDHGRTVVGELDGTFSSRLQRVAQAFERTSRPIKVERDIDAWLKTHAAVVVPLAHAVYLAGGDVYRLARTRDGLVLAVRAVRECFRAMRAQGVAVTPGWFRALEWVPEPALVAILGRVLRSRRAEFGLAGHANVARDEMRHLAGELEELIRPANTPTAALDHLLTFGDADEPPMLDGRAVIPLEWRDVWVSAGALAAALLLVRHLIPRG